MEEAYEIFDYLPLNRQPVEDNYILHLWDSYSALIDRENSAQSFALMPFHLLFMLALQYKVMRIAKSFEKHCLLIFSINGGRDRDKILSLDRSVFDLATINERALPEMFQLVDLDKNVILKIKNLIDYRNVTLAHAKGGIEIYPGKKVGEYLETLRNLQKCMVEMNDLIAEKWVSEIDDVERLKEHVELHLFEEYLSPADMQQGKLAKLNKKYSIL